MFHIFQRARDDCGVAAAAMATGLSYEEASVICLKLCLNPIAVEIWSMRRILETITQAKWRISWPAWHAEIKFFLPLRGVIILGIEHEYRHWVVANNGMIHDPEFLCAFTLRTYPRKRWKVFVYLKPADEDWYENYMAQRRTLVMQQLEAEMNRDGGAGRTHQNLPGLPGD